MEPSSVATANPVIQVGPDTGFQLGQVTSLVGRVSRVSRVGRLLTFLQIVVVMVIIHFGLKWNEISKQEYVFVIIIKLFSINALPLINK